MPEPVHAPLIEKYRKHSPVLADCTTFEMQGNTTMYLPYKSAHGAVAATTETGARTEQTEPTFTGGADTSLQAFDYYSDQRATQQLLDDVPGFEETLLEWVYEDFMEQLNADACVGAGASAQSLAGIFAASATYLTCLSGSAGAIANTRFSRSSSSCRSSTARTRSGTCRRSPSPWPWASPCPTWSTRRWSSRTPATARFPSSASRWSRSTTRRSIGATKYPIALGDLSAGYAVGIHKQPTILRDPFTAKPQVIFYGLGSLRRHPVGSQRGRAHEVEQRLGGARHD